MNYQEFREELIINLKKSVEEDICVTLHRNTKNNGIVRWAVSLKRKEDVCVPTVYLESFFEEYESHKSTLDEICMKIIEVFDKYRTNEQIEFSVEEFKSFDNVKSNIYCKLINTERNEEILKNIPHKEFEDLSIVFYYLVIENENGTHTTLVNNKCLNIWNISENELYDIAIDNTVDKCGMRVNHIRDILSKIYLCDEYVNDTEDTDGTDVERDIDNFYEILEKINENKSEPMYILSNDKMLFGATVMLYKPLLNAIATNLESDIYILPSSIHEVIVVPKYFVGDVQELKNMVVDVNNSVVDAEEILSNNVYIYDRENNNISIA